MTAAEVIDAGANHKLPSMELTTWRNQTSVGKVVKGNMPVANNYLTEDEASKPDRFVNMFPDHGENLAEQGKKCP